MYDEENEDRKKNQNQTSTLEYMKDDDKQYR